MTTPRFGTDPLSGASYAYKGQLTSAQMNQLLGWLRGIDYAIEYNQAFSWPVATVQTGVLGKAITFDKATTSIHVLSQHTAAGTVNVRRYTASGDLKNVTAFSAPAGGWTTTTYGIAVSSPTVTIVGGATVNASAQKIATHAAADEVYTIRSTNNAEAGVGPKCGVWDPTNGLFIIGLNGTGTGGKIETSADGQTWAGRTAPAATTPSAIATDGSGTTVMLLSGAGTSAWRSTNGTSWAAVTMPASASWSAITYSKGLGLWIASDGTAALAHSVNGSTWTTATFSGVGVNEPAFLGSTKNLVIGTYNENVLVSADGSFFVRSALTSGFTTINDMKATDDIILFLVNDTTDGKFLASSMFRI